MTPKTNLLINAYFALTDTLDMLLREVEQQIWTVEYGEMRYDVKKAHNLLIGSAKDFHRKFDLYMDKARIDSLASKTDYDTSRMDANELLRLILLYADRCDAPDRAMHLMQELSSFPEKALTNEYVKQFNIK